LRYFIVFYHKEDNERNLSFEGTLGITSENFLIEETVMGYLEEPDCSSAVTNFIEVSKEEMEQYFKRKIVIPGRDKNNIDE